MSLGQPQLIINDIKRERDCTASLSVPSSSTKCASCGTAVSINDLELLLVHDTYSVSYRFGYLCQRQIEAVD